MVPGDAYVVTRSPPQTAQAQATQVHTVDGLVVPAWVAQEQQQQAIQQQQQHQQNNPMQDAEAQRIAKEKKMTLAL